jgi:hypothetical protein
MAGNQPAGDSIHVLAPYLNSYMLGAGRGHIAAFRAGSLVAEKILVEMRAQSTLIYHQEKVSTIFR